MIFDGQPSAAHQKVWALLGKRYALAVEEERYAFLKRGAPLTDLRERPLTEADHYF